MPKEQVQRRPVEAALGQARASQNNAGNSQAGTGDIPKIPKSRNRHLTDTQEAIAVLRRNHKIVSDLFDVYERIDGASRKRTLVFRICIDLTIHAQVEDEILYPALNQVLKDKRLLPRAMVEHERLKELIAQVGAVEPDDQSFDAKVQVLSEYVKHHVKEKQNELFPRISATILDMKELGGKIASRKQQLLAERARLVQAA